MSRIQMLKQQLQQEKMDGIVITSTWNRRYISNFTGTAGTVFITQNQAYFITDFRYIEQAKKQCTGFQVIQQDRHAFTEIAKLVKEQKLKKLAFEKDHTTVSVFEMMQKMIPSQLIGVSNWLEKQRCLKSEQEIQMIQKAAQIADEAFSYILKEIRPGITELEVSHMLDFKMRALGASGVSFDTIVASGIRSALPHGVASEKVIEIGDMVTLDFGAYYQGYCSDITRTFALGEPDAQLVEIYDVVLEAQKRGIACLKPGIEARDVDAITRTYITEKGYGEYFGHSTGHGIGLEIHELPTLSHATKQTLLPGMIVTVEPGIYVPQLGGVRIEDDVLITETGYQVLTHSTKELIVL